MQRNVFNPEEVLAARQALGNWHRDLGLVLAGPRQAPAADGRPLFEDLEPDVSASIPVGCRLAAWHLGHVELEGSWVGDGALGCEADGRTSGDLVGALGTSSRRELVAADLVRCNLWSRWVSRRYDGADTSRHTSVTGPLLW